MIMQAGDAEVWWAAPADGQRQLARLLDPLERARWRKFASPKAGESFLVAAALLRLVAAAQLGVSPESVSVVRTCAYCGGPHGPPRVGPPDASLTSSISHAGDSVAVAISRVNPVGIDVEPIAQALDIPTMAGLVLSPSEAQQVLRLAPVQRRLAFLRCWTRKEAVLKATATGLRAKLTEITVSVEASPRLETAPWARDTTSQVNIFNLPRAGHIASLAAIGVVGRISHGDGGELIASWLS